MANYMIYMQDAWAYLRPALEIAILAFLTMRRAEIIRVHDVRAMKDVVTMFSRCAGYIK